MWLVLAGWLEETHDKMSDAHASSATPHHEECGGAELLSDDEEDTIRVHPSSKCRTASFRHLVHAQGFSAPVMFAC